MPPNAEIERILRLSPVMPVVVIHDAALAPELARALVRGGIRVVEVTLRTPAALPAIEAIARQVPEIALGAGTVLCMEDLRAAASAGATFAISPGATPALLSAAASAPIPYLPAVATASELMQGLAAGYHCFKFFPAGPAGGPRDAQGVGRSVPTGALLSYRRHHTRVREIIPRPAERPLRRWLLAVAGGGARGSRLEANRGPGLAGSGIQNLGAFTAVELRGPSRPHSEHPNVLTPS